MDLAANISQFHQLTAGMRHYEHCIDEVFSEIMYYLAYNNNAREGIDALYQDLKRCYDEPGCDDGELIAAAASQLATATHAQLVEHQLYCEGGQLPYYPSAWLSGGTPTLRKFNSDRLIKRVTDTYDAKLTAPPLPPSVFEW